MQINFNMALSDMSSKLDLRLYNNNYTLWLCDDSYKIDMSIKPYTSDMYCSTIFWMLSEGYTSFMAVR